MILPRILIVATLFAGLGGVVFAQRPSDVKGLNNLIFGETIEEAYHDYAQVLVPIAVHKHSAKDLVERLRAPRYPVGDIPMVLSLYTRGDDNKIVKMVLSLRNEDHAMRRGPYVIDILRRMFGKPQESERSAPSMVDNNAIYVWKFPSATITLTWTGDMVLRVDLIPV